MLAAASNNPLLSTDRPSSLTELGRVYAQKAADVQVVLLVCTLGPRAVVTLISAPILPAGAGRASCCVGGVCAWAGPGATKGALAAIVTAATAAGSRRR